MLLLLALLMGILTLSLLLRYVARHFGSEAGRIACVKTTGNEWQRSILAKKAAIPQFMFFDARKPLCLKGFRAIYVF